MSEVATGAVREARRRSGVIDFAVKMVKTKPLGTACAGVVLLFVLSAIFADVIAPYPPDELNVLNRLQGSSAAHLLGTDQVGRDLLTRLIYGSRISLLVGLSATTINVLVAILLGGGSGFLGGKVDIAVQRVVDAWIAFPGLLLLLTIMSLTGKGLLQMILVLGVAGGVEGSRVPRSAVIAIKENDYFQAARAIGTSTRWTLLRHVVPNIMAPMIIVFSISVGGNILSAAALSFLGYGLPAGMPDWGGMLSQEGLLYMESAPWLAFWPGVCLTVIVYSLNMLGDALRDLLDPRLRGSTER
ncbi:MAG: ABC transporter permease [Spirochaetaceae bacterium]|nr:ABC transporter permease [Spirochaetaceae bacterium]